MIDKEIFIDFLNRHFEFKKITVQHFDSGCSMVDIYINEDDVLCVLLEPSQIGISKVKDYSNSFDLSTISDNIFYSNTEAEYFVIKEFK